MHWSFTMIKTTCCNSALKTNTIQKTLIIIIIMFYICHVAQTHLKRLLSSKSEGGSVVIRLTSSCMQWSWERKRSNRRFWALHSCRTSSSSISSLSVTSSLSSSWSMWEVVCRSNFQNMAAAVMGDTALGGCTVESTSLSYKLYFQGTLGSHQHSIYAELMWILLPMHT